MSTNVMLASHHTTDASHLSPLQTDLELQNDQLWSIITQQKNVIRDLESALARMTKERDLLLLRTTTTTATAMATATPATLPSPLTCSQEPIPPPRSPYRQRSHNSTVDITETTNRSRCSSSSTTDDAPTTGKAGGSIHAIVGKDAELFANYQKGLTPSSSLSSGVDDNYDDDGGHDDDRDNNKANNNENEDDEMDHDDSATTSITGPLSPPPASPSQQTRHALVMEATDLDTKNYTSFCTTMALKVLDIHLQHISKHKETISFIISVSRHSTPDMDSQQELWRIKKGYSEFMALDTLLRSRLRALSKKNDTTTFKMGKLPAKSLFTTTKSTTTTMDQKKRVIERYLTNVIRLPLPATMDLIQFLSSGVLEQKEWSTTPKQAKCEKEGYVSLYGKQSKKWHPYYFMLYGSTLNYYEDDSKDGHLIGSLSLKDCQMTVHRSSTPGLFYHISSRSTITLIQRSSSSASKHPQYMLRMASDTELDEWMQAFSPVTQPAPQISRSECLGTLKTAEGPNSLRGGGSTSSRKRLSNRILPSTKHAPPQRSQSDNSVGSLMPSITTTLDTCRQQQQQQQQKQRKRSSIDAIFYSTRRPPPPQPPQVPQESQSTRHTPSISALLPSASTSLLTRRHANDTTTTTTKAAAAAATTKLNRRTFWPKSMFLGQGQESHGLRGFLARHATDHHLTSTSPSPALSSTTNTYRTSPAAPATTTTTTIKQSAPLPETSLANVPIHPTFGVPLEKALQVSKTHGLPSIVYRCIQFLERKKAIYEEGIYRISGSTIKIKGLRRRFDEQGDIDLLALEEFRDCDIHAVSGLLKLWLRELPGHILTDRLIDSFILVKDAMDRHDCLSKLSRLIAKLPSANYTLLRALMAHLHCVTRNANVNKMTLKNMAIVFSPTLAIPTSIFDLFLSEFDTLFMSRKKHQQQQASIDNNKVHGTIPSMSAERRRTISNSSRRHQKRVDTQNGLDQDEVDKDRVKTEGMGFIGLDPPKPMIKT